MNTSVYIFGDANLRRPLYIGISDDILRREREHSRKSAWYREATHIWAAGFSTREVALGAEAMLIGLYRPEGNTAHRGKVERLDLSKLSGAMTADDLISLDQVQWQMVSIFEAAEKSGRESFDALLPKLLASGTIGALAESEVAA